MQGREISLDNCHPSGFFLLNDDFGLDLDYDRQCPSRNEMVSPRSSLRPIGLLLVEHTARRGR